jgi:hypothetical protein
MSIPDAAPSRAARGPGRSRSCAASWRRSGPGERHHHEDDWRARLEKEHREERRHRQQHAARDAPAPVHARTQRSRDLGTKALAEEIGLPGDLWQIQAAIGELRAEWETRRSAASLPEGSGDRPTTRPKDRRPQPAGELSLDITASARSRVALGFSSSSQKPAYFLPKVARMGCLALSRLRRAGPAASRAGARILPERKHPLRIEAQASEKEEVGRSLVLVYPRGVW